MHIHLRIQRWVVWWFYVGVVCGVIALSIILGHQFTRAQEENLTVVGSGSLAAWAESICWAFDSVRVEARQAPAAPLRSYVENHRGHRVASRFGLSVAGRKAQSCCPGGTENSVFNAEAQRAQR